ncbi:amino acid adenylation domain-containing protein [Umezawaea sp. NPDC059074]|uniref:non-ribosomal peptide synthetase n=1 Tax=Umezawaea sp. NPDC059074 TaxID=3346716 RepID=UPI003694F0C3
MSTTRTVPVSSAQRGLWLIDELHPRSSLYTVFCAVRLTGPLDVAALHRALERVVARHEALRTTFLPGPVGRVVEDLPVPLPVTDLADVPAAERFAAATALVDGWAEEPFDLAEGPLLRALVVRLADDDHLLGLAVHHVVCDGRSVHVLFDELARLYAGEDLPELPARFQDYVTTRHEDAERVAWWRGYLAGAPDVLTPPTDRPRPAVRGTAGATHLLHLPGPLVADMVAMATRRRTSPFMVLLAAYSALLGRLADVRELLVGTPVSGRDVPEFESLIGLFVDTVPVRVDLSGDPTFDGLVRRVRGSVLDVLAHQGVPFDRIVEEARPDRSPSHTPLVQSAFSAEMAPFATPRFAGLEAELRLPLPTTAKFDLDLTIQRAPEGDDFVGILTYSTELFDAATVERFAERFVRLLATGVADPDTPLRSLPLLDPSERTMLLDEWSESAPGRPADLFVHELFARQAAKTPDAPAVSLHGVELTYADLDERADRLAADLRARGVGPDEVVGVLLPRGVELVTTLLAVLKADAAYLPLSPTHPPGYLARVLATAKSRHVVADPTLAHRLDGTGVTVVDPAGLPAAGPAPSRRSSPDDLAYVLFTSGSTGEPKGVAVTHGALANVATTMVDHYGLTDADRVLQFANVGFDIHAEELYPTWAAGGCVVLTPDPPPGPEELIGLMGAERVTFTILTSSYWRQWADRARRDGVHPGETVRLVSIGAEPVDRETLTWWQREVGVPVVNIYGLTETTVNATATWLDAPVLTGSVPIGVPLDGVRAYVLDRELEPVPVGVPGELYLGGDCLARGYLGRADLTADRFVPDPFGTGSRLHRSGDRARWLPTGELEVLGRLDKQVKVRGYRIEPGHIEAALRAHPDITDALVVPRGDRLVGYVVPSEVPADLRDHLSGRLPVHLVPSAFVGLPAIPLNANGKVDTKALPEPAAAVSTAVPASTDLERRIAEVWRQVLGLDRVGVHDNFFELGGSSLALASVHSRLRDELGRTLPMVALYEYPTIAALARHLSTENDTGADQRADRLLAGRARLTRERRARR